MKVRELRDMSINELLQKEKELREELFRLRIRKGSGPLESPAMLRNLRRDIARIKTILKERGNEGA
ncbi:MAG TPA: 50S ribosomal protein L29 [Syntrophales bacterium]|nr:50S ribosomal protein L29 [Syntrophales bacterium]HOL58885.1 50S ribosomal protein L29 [Syntrophales bacterium]HPO35212.1 50S ribosomal protein L29 [Syntrophales bacterium]